MEMATRSTAAQGAWSMSAVTLRPHTPDQLASFLIWYGDPDLARLTRHDQTPLSPEQIRAYFTEVVLPDSTRGHCFGIHRADSGELIGTCSLTDFSADGRSAILRILLGPHECWGHGYGTQAIRLLVAYGFNTLGLRAISLGVFANNERAIRSYRKVGFQTVGTTRLSFSAPGAEVLMVVTPEGFAQAQRAERP